MAKLRGDLVADDGLHPAEVQSAVGDGRLLGAAQVEFRVDSAEFLVAVAAGLGEDHFVVLRQREDQPVGDDEVLLVGPLPIGMLPEQRSVRQSSSRG